MNSPDAKGRAYHQIRRAFTLVELLVVMAIIGILTGLLLPAVQQVREAARRTECGNNLRQIGIAFQSHHASYRFFPTGGWNWSDPPTYLPRPAIGANQRAGWGFQILPFVEGQNTYRAGAIAAIGSPHSVFFCPSRRSPQTIELPDNYNPPLSVPTVQHALCDYAASNRAGTGTVRRYEPVRIRDVTDGTTHTALVGGKRLNLRFLGQPQDDDNEGYTAGWNEDTIRRTDRPPLPDYRADTGDGDKLFGSSHPGLVNFVLADGSVRAIPFSIDPVVFDQFGNRSDGQVFEFDF